MFRIPAIYSRGGSVQLGLTSSKHCRSDAGSASGTRTSSTFARRRHCTVTSNATGVAGVQGSGRGTDDEAVSAGDAQRETSLTRS